MAMLKVVRKMKDSNTFQERIAMCSKEQAAISSPEHAYEKATTASHAQEADPSNAIQHEVEEAEARYVKRRRMMRNCLIVGAHILMAVLIVLIIMPGKRSTPTIVPFMVVVGIAEALYVVSLVRKGTNRFASSWIMIIVWAILIAWELVSTTLGIVSPVLFPTPEAVFNVFPTQWQTFLVNTASSLQLLCMGALTAILAGLILGSICGWVPALQSIFAPIARVLAPIPSVVFSPYLILLMPTFRIASATIIFLGIFWPMFLNTIIRVNSMDRRIVESSRMLGLSSFEMVKDVILPYLVPGVINGLNGQLTAAFTMLTFAEMLGAKSGLGYYIINYTNFANYVNVLAGIIMVAVLITVLNWLINVLRRNLVKWR